MQTVTYRMDEQQGPVINRIRKEYEKECINMYN